MAALAGGGCFARDPIDIRSEDPGSKIPAIRRAARQQDMRAARQLVRDLDSDDPAVRFFAIRALRGLTAEDYGYQYWADEESREPAVKQWRAWLDRQEDPKE